MGAVSRVILSFFFAPQPFLNFQRTLSPGPTIVRPGSWATHLPFCIFSFTSILWLTPAVAAKPAAGGGAAGAAAAGANGVGETVGGAPASGPPLRRLSQATVASTIRPRAIVFLTGHLPRPGGPS